MTRQRAWFYSAIIVGVLVLATVVVGSSGGQLGFSSGNGVLNAMSVIGRA